MAGARCGVDTRAGSGPDRGVGKNGCPRIGHCVAFKYEQHGWNDLS